MAWDIVMEKKEEPEVPGRPNDFTRNTVLVRKGYKDYVTLGLSHNQSGGESKVIRLLSIIHNGIILDFMCGFQW